MSKSILPHSDCFTTLPLLLSPDVIDFLIQIVIDAYYDSVEHALTDAQSLAEDPLQQKALAEILLHKLTHQYAENESGA